MDDRCKQNVQIFQQSCDLMLIKHHMLVHVIADHEDIVLLAQATNLVNLVPAEHFAQRIVWVVEDDGLGFGGEHLPQLFGVQLPVA